VQEHHGIDSAGHRDNHSVTVGQEATIFDGFLNAVNQIAHAAMLCFTPVRGE
jgi:hypothetical protein